VTLRNQVVLSLRLNFPICKMKGFYL
jgi:hypothetical protein